MLRLRRGPAGHSDACATWLREQGWRQISSTQVADDLADWALVHRTWPGRVHSRFDGQVTGREATVQTWSTHRRLGALPLRLTAYRQVIAVRAVADVQPVIVRPRALVGRFEPPVWPGAAEVTSGGVFIAAAPAVLADAVPMLSPLLAQILHCQAQVAVSATHIVISAANQAPLDRLADRLALASELVAGMERAEER